MTIGKDEVMFLDSFGKRLRQVRHEKGLTCRVLSELSGLDSSKISKIERGTVNITVTTLADLCKGLDISISEFFNETS